MKTTFILTALSAFLFLITGLGHAGEILREPLDQLWESHMLAGTPGVYSGGKNTGFVGDRPLDQVLGIPEEANFTRYGISVQDMRGTTWLGLFQGGGWSLEGGLLERIALDHSTVELYGKGILRWTPGLLGITHYAKKEEAPYEFFLLKRESGAARATVLKKWVIPPQDIFWYVPGREHETDVPEHVKQMSETRNVRGFLKYDSDRHEAEVTITGLTHPLVERVLIPRN